METKDLRKRKFLMILPVMLVPFIVLFFYSLGGGQSTVNKKSTAKGLNTNLPAAQLSNSPMDKLSIYELADKDSLKKADELKNDPFISHDRVTTAGGMEKSYPLPGPFDNSATYHATSLLGRKYIDSNEAKVTRKLEELRRQLSTTMQTDPVYKRRTEDSSLFQRDNPFDPPSFSVKSVPAALQPASQPDSEIIRLNAMLEKVMDIQHPERVTAKLNAQSVASKPQSLSFRPTPPDETVGLLSSQPDNTIFGNRYYSDSLRRLLSGYHQPNSFFDLDTDSTDVIQTNAIEGVIPETQTVVSGSTVKIRLLQDIYYHDQVIPAGTYVSGPGILSGERLNIQIQTIQYKNSLFPVSFTVYGLDGMPGIAIKGAISRDVAGQGADNGLQSLQLASLNPSVGAQAASAGIETAKTFFSKKIKLIKVTLKAGDPVLLKVNNQ